MTKAELAEFREYQALKRQAAQSVTSANSAPPSALPHIDEKEMCIQNFMSMFEHMLNAIAYVFPECQKTKNALEDFRLANNSKITKVKLIESWHNTMQPHYQAVLHRDEVALRNAQISHLERIDMLKKWDDPGFNKESKDNLWECLEELNRYAGMYQSIQNIPPALMNNIHNVAAEVFTAFQEGGAKLDNLDLGKLGQRVVSQSNMTDVRAFLANMPQISKNFGGMDNLMRVAQGGMGSINNEMSSNQQ